MFLLQLQKYSYFDVVSIKKSFSVSEFMDVISFEDGLSGKTKDMLVL